MLRCLHLVVKSTTKDHVQDGNHIDEHLPVFVEHGIGLEVVNDLQNSDQLKQTLHWIIRVLGMRTIQD